VVLADKIEDIISIDDHDEADPVVIEDVISITNNDETNPWRRRR
jgi:hypothetical protein